MIKTKSINIMNLNIPCANRCRYCLLSWDGKTIGIDYQRSKKYAKEFYEWLKDNHPEIKFIYYFGYSMDHPELFDAIRFMQQTESPSGHFLQFDGMNYRTHDQLEEFIKKLKDIGIELLNFTFYGTRTYHDKFACRIGDYDLMMNTIEIAIKNNINVEVGIPVTKENLNQLDELVDNFTSKKVKLFLFTPHCMGRGISLLESKITVNDYNNMSDKVKALFNRNNNQTPQEWINSPVKEVEYRTLSLSLQSSNIDILEKQSFSQTLKELEDADDSFHNIIPSFNTLLKKYVNNEDQCLYTKKDLYYLYRRKFIEEYKLNIKDITDERFSGSFRY